MVFVLLLYINFTAIMSNIYRLFTCIIITLFLANCSNKNQEVKDYEKHVIDIHDEVMVKTNGLFKIKKRLKSSLSSTSDSSKVYDIIAKLNEADEAMMVWMDQYKIVDIKADHDSNMEYLKKQEIEINKVKTLTDDAIRLAEEYLK